MICQIIKPILSKGPEAESTWHCSILLVHNKGGNVAQDNIYFGILTQMDDLTQVK